MSAPGLHRVQHLSLRLSQTMQRAIGLLQLDNAELSGLLIEEAARNPALTVTLAMPDEAPVRRGPFGGGSGSRPGRLPGRMALIPTRWARRRQACMIMFRRRSG